MLSITVALTVASAAAWDYTANGADWNNQGLCGTGGPQSPIDLPAVAPASKDKLAMFLKYPKLETAVKVYNNGKSIALTLPESFRSGFGYGLEKDGAKAFKSEDAEAYRLWQVNFHAPSEHTIKGKRMPLEMQMMHERVTGGKGLAAVVVLFDETPNDYSSVLDAVLGKDGLPKKPWDEVTRNNPLEFGSLLGGSSFNTYNGSLTVPPCEQQVKYFVRSDPVPAAISQLQQFKEVLGETCKPKGNYRLAQPLAGGIVSVASVDLVSSPDKFVRPKEPQLKEEQEAQAGAAQANAVQDVDGKCIDTAFKNHGRIAVGESQEMIDAKTSYNKAKRDLQATQTNLGKLRRDLETAKSLYDNAPGVAEKITLKWNLINAEKLLASEAGMLPERVSNIDKEYANINAQILWHCIAQQKRLAEEAAKSKPTVAPAPPKAVYAEPHVKLPTGLAGSPFSDKTSSDATTVSDKIAVNLQQPESPPSASTEEAAGQDAPAEKTEARDTTMAVRLPISVGAGDFATFSKDLKEALAKVANIDSSRFEVKELTEVSIPSVVAPTLLQTEPRRLLPRRMLRRQTRAQ